MQHHILDWILEQEKDISRKTGEIWKKVFGLVVSVISILISLTNMPWLCKKLTLEEDGWWVYKKCLCYLYNSL